MICIRLEYFPERETSVLNDLTNPVLVTGYTKVTIIMQKANLPEKLVYVIPVAAALLESQEVSKGCCIRLDTETPRLPLSCRNPRHIYVEAVKIISRAQLSGTHLQCHKVKVSGQVKRKAWSKLDVSADSQCLRVGVLCDDLIVRELIGLSVAV